MTILSKLHTWLTFASAILLASLPQEHAQAASCTPAPSGVVAWWAAEGDANDRAGTNNGTFQNGASFDTGEVGQAFSFDGSGNNVFILASPVLDVGQGNGLTIEGWINPADLTSGQPILEWALNGTYGVHFWVSGSTSGSLYANLFGTDNLSHSIESAPGILTANMFQHVAVTYDKVSGIARLFLNGAMVQQSTLGTFTPRTSSNLYIAYRPDGSPFGPIPFTGLIDEMTLYSRALSGAELQTIYNAGTSGKCAVETLPSLRIARAGQNIALSWPLPATNFGLQVAEGALPPFGTFTNLSATPIPTNNENVVTLPLGATTRFFRLFHP